MRERAMDELKHGLEWSREKAGDLRERFPRICVRNERSTLSVVVGVTLVLVAILGVVVWVSRRLAEEDERVAAEGGEELESADTEVEKGEVRARGTRSRREREASDEV
jgi:hypothetical protein